MKEAIQVSILNQSFPVETEAEDNHVEKVAKLVNKKVKEIQSQSQKASSLHVALLACMNLADDFLRLKVDHKQRMSKAEKKLSDLIEIIDLQL